MKRRVLGGLTPMPWVLSLGLVGCGSAGVDTGVPRDTSKSDVPLDAVSTDMGGRMSKDVAKANAKVKAATAQPSPSGEAPAEKP